MGQCAKSPVPCPSNCARSIPREKISNHTTNDCPLSLISCPYEQIGCKRKVQRREMKSHLESDVKPHLDLACVKLETRTFIWKIEHFSEVLRQAKAGEKNRIESIPFYTDRTESYGYKLRVWIYPNDDRGKVNTHLSVYIVVMEGEYDAILPWPFNKKVNFTLIDQQEDPVERENVTIHLMAGNHPKNFARPRKNDISIGCGFSEFVTHDKLHSRRYIVDDTLFLQVEVGPSSS